MKEIDIIRNNRSGVVTPTITKKHKDKPKTGFDLLFYFRFVVRFK